MHFPIIAIESLETEKADFTEELNYDDSTLNRYCDYYGEKYDEEEREKVIKSGWLKKLLEGIATIDEEKETITFLDEETIRCTIWKYLVELTQRLHDDAVDDKLTVFDLRWAAKEYKEYSTLFYVGYGQTSFEYIEDAPYMAGQTVKIGNIFDAHF